MSTPAPTVATAWRDYAALVHRCAPGSPHAAAPGERERFDAAAELLGKSPDDTLADHKKLRAVTVAAAEVASIQQAIGFSEDAAWFELEQFDKATRHIMAARARNRAALADDLTARHRTATARLASLKAAIAQLEASDPALFRATKSKNGGAPGAPRAAAALASARPLSARSR